MGGGERARGLIFLRAVVRRKKREQREEGEKRRKECSPRLFSLPVASGKKRSSFCVLGIDAGEGAALRGKRKKEVPVLHVSRVSGKKCLALSGGSFEREREQ